jgi:tetratricopeptide (TPR) repeat protein
VKRTLRLARSGDSGGGYGAGETDPLENLSSDARAILDAGREGDGAGDLERARGRRAVMATIAAGGGAAALATTSSAAASGPTAAGTAAAARMTLSAKLLLLLAMFAVALAPLAVAAQTPKDDARQECERGTIEYTLGNFAGAIAHYERGYRFLHDPAFLFNLGQAHRQAGAYEAALATYRSFLRTSPPDAPNRELAEKRIRELAAKLDSADLVPRPAPGPVPLPAVSPPTTSAARSSTLLTKSVPDEDHSATHWWLWGAAGSVVVATGVAAILVLASRPQEVIAGNEGTAVIK